MKAESGPINTNYSLAIDRTYYQQITLPAANKFVRYIKAKVEVLTTGGNIRFALYADDSDEPDAKIAEKTNFEIDELGYLRIDFGEFATTAKVWVAIQRSAATTIDDASSGTIYRHGAEAYAAGFPANAGSTTADVGNDILWFEIGYSDCEEGDLFMVNFDPALDSVEFVGGPLRLVNNSYSQLPPRGVYGYTNARYSAQMDFSHFKPIVERYQIFGDDDDADLLAGILATQEMIERTRQAHGDIIDPKFSFLRSYGVNEEVKQCLMYIGYIKMLSQNGVNKSLKDDKALAEIEIERSPLWESVYDAAQQITESGFSCLAGTKTFSSIPGDTFARINKLFFDSGPASGAITEMWLGIRETFNGVANFDPLWEAEDGTDGTGSATVADATASGGDKKQVSFGTSTLVSRLTIELEDIEAVAANRADFHGIYLVLARMKVTAASTIGVQLYSGVTRSEFAWPEIFLTNSNWYLYALGEIEIPMGGNFPDSDGLSDPRHSSLNIYAEHISGTVGSDKLDIDCFILIPAQHILHVSDCDIQDGATASEMYTFVHVNGLQQCFNFENDGDTARDKQNDATFRNWFLPRDDGIMVLAGNRASSHVLTDTLDMEMDYIPRWHILRGE